MTSVARSGGERYAVPAWSWGRVFLFSIGLWSVMAVVDMGKDSLVLFLFDQPITLRVVSDSSVWWGMLIPLTPAVLALAHVLPPRRRGRALAVTVHVPAAVSFGLAHLLLATCAFQMLGGELTATGVYRQFRSFFARYILFDLFVYAALVAGYWARDYYYRYRARAAAAAALQVRASKLERLAVEARLEALRWQLNPHFLFNALNAASALVRRREPDAAVAMLARLSALLRSTLDDATSGDVPLSRELELVSLYVAVEQARFRDRLQVELRADEEVLSAQVPALILQPLVENAIRHGMAASSRSRDVTVEARRDGDTLALTVRDSGPGFASHAAPPASGIGLSNTRARLQHRYGSEASFEVATDVGGGAVVSVTVPLVIGATA